MRTVLKARLCTAALSALGCAAVVAQEADTPSGTEPIVCTSVSGQHRHCPADTTEGVVLARSTGSAACARGSTWGYDDTSVWVADGCSAEFVVGATAASETAPAVEPPEKERESPTDLIESWGEFAPGDGFLVGRNDLGELSISAYALVRYVNQEPAGQTFTDHLGTERPVDARQDIYPHRAMIFFKGWVGTPKLVYNIFLWTVNTTDQDAIFGTLGYQFSQKFTLFGGINALPGTRSLQGSHPYWLGSDRVLADEFFRPYLTFGVWAQGEILDGLWYNVMVGNNSSALGVKASQLDRDQSYGASMWWTPTTKEFGPRGAFGDWEMHEELATRFGVSFTESPEERFTDGVTGASGNTTMRLADSLNVFDTGALASGVTVSNVDYRLLSVDAGMKYRGTFLQAELYKRTLDGFVADGLVPMTSIEDDGFYVQASFYPLPKKLELYAATSQIYGDSDAGFGDSSEYIVGMNYYPANTRNHRLNAQVIDVDRSAASSVFGYYVGGQDGKTYSVGFSVFF